MSNPEDTIRAFFYLKNNSHPVVFEGLEKIKWETTGNEVSKLEWKFKDPKRVIGFIALEQIAMITYETY